MIVVFQKSCNWMENATLFLCHPGFNWWELLKKHKSTVWFEQQTFTCSKSRIQTKKDVIYSKLTTETLERVVSFLLTFNISHAFFWCCYSCLWAGECLLGCDRNLFVLKIISVDTGWAFPSKSSKNIWQLSPSRSLYIDYEQVFAHWSSPPLLEHHNNVRNLFKVNNKETTTTSFTSF